MWHVILTRHIESTAVYNTAESCSVTVVFDEIYRVYRTENRIGKKQLRRRRRNRINKEMPSNQPFTTNDDDAIEVQYVGWYRPK